MRVRQIKKTFQQKWSAVLKNGELENRELEIKRMMLMISVMKQMWGRELGELGSLSRNRSAGVVSLELESMGGQL